MSKKTTKTETVASRRKFLKSAGLAAGGVAVAGVAAPNIARAEPTVMKMQAAWGGGIFLENAKSYVDRVHAMAGKDLKIDLLAVNSVVKTSQMQDAVHRGVLDAAHYVPAYWYSKSKAASLFGTGPCFGWSSQEVLGWVHYGGGMELFNELMGSLGLNVVSVFNSPMPAQPLGWFKEADQRRLADERPEVPHRRSCGRCPSGNGHVGGAAPRWRNPAGHEVGPDRRGGIQQSDVGPRLRHAGRFEALSPGELPPEPGVLRRSPSTRASSKACRASFRRS